MRKKLAAAIGAVVLSLGIGSAAWATPLVTFNPIPGAPAGTVVYDLSWNGAQLFETPLAPNGGGLIGTDEGLNPISAQVPGGVMIHTPLTIASPMAVPSAAGGTDFYDTTFHLTGLNAVAPGFQSAFGVVDQTIGRGTFEIRSSKYIDPKTNLQTYDLLLTGIVANADILGLPTSASVVSQTVTYTGGKIYDALIASGGSPMGDLSWTLLNFSSPLHNGGGNLAPFDANTNGQFNATIPEPASLGVLGIAALGLIRRRRK